LSGPSKLQVFLAATGAVVPPAVLEGGLPELDIGRFPPGSEHLRIPMGKRGHLEGVYVPGDPGGPLVLHLLASHASVTYGVDGLGGFPILGQLRDLGLASLMLDYRGVGASSGSRSPKNLPEDATAAWDEALRRVDGDAARIVLRGMSLGTLAVAILLEKGAQPGGVVLVAPVRAETVVKNWARHYYPAYLARLTTGFVRPSVGIDVVQVFSRCKQPLIVYAPRDDYLLPGFERLLLEESVEIAGGRWIRSRFGHPANVLNAQSLFPSERRFYPQRFKGVPQSAARIAQALEALPAGERETFLPGGHDRGRLEDLCNWYRLDPPVLACALSRTRGSHEDEAPLLRWLRHLPFARYAGLPFEALLALVELDDAAAPIVGWELEQLADYLAEEEESRGTRLLPEDIAPLADALALHRSVLSLPCVVRDASGWVRAEPGPSEAALRRRALRMVLKAVGMPDRSTPRGVEFWAGGAEGDWRLVPGSNPAA